MSELKISDKYDTDSAKAIIEMGYPANEQYLMQLLKCMRDNSGPVAEMVTPYLATLGEPLIPHIKEILNGDDNEWKYWCLSFIIHSWSSQDIIKIVDELQHIADTPTAGERLEHVDVEARLILNKI